MEILRTLIKAYMFICTCATTTAIFIMIEEHIKYKLDNRKKEKSD